MGAKERIDAVVDAIREQNNQYSSLLESAVQINRENANNMNRMVLNIQFQDRTNQIIGDWVDYLAAHSAILAPRAANTSIADV